MAPSLDHWLAILLVPHFLNKIVFFHFYHMTAYQRIMLFFFFLIKKSFFPKSLVVSLLVIWIFSMGKENVSSSCQEESIACAARFLRSVVYACYIMKIRRIGREIFQFMPCLHLSNKNNIPWDVEAESFEFTPFTSNLKPLAKTMAPDFPV